MVCPMARGMSFERVVRAQGSAIAVTRANKKEAAIAAASLDPASHMEMLLELGRNAVELGIQAGTDGVDRGDDDYGNSRSN